MSAVRKIYKWLKPFILPLVLVLMGLALWGMRDKIVEVLANAKWHLVFVALGIALLYLPLNASIWGVILQAFGVKVTRREAAVTWLRCEALRWLPGSIWGYASRASEARKFGGSKLVAGLSLTVELAITVLAWATLAFIGLGLSGFIFELLDRVSPEIKRTILAVLGIGIFSAISLPIIFRILPAKFRNPVASKFKVVKVEIKEPKKLLQAFLEYTCLNFVYSLGFYLCFLALTQSETPGFLASIGANGMGWIVGLFSIGVPSGIGVREGVIAMVFQPFNLVAEAGAGAFLWRGVQLAVEMIFLISILIFRFLKKAPAQRTVNHSEYPSGSIRKGCKRPAVRSQRNTSHE